ncbi:MAG: 4-alpha-glucanotransferase [Kiritimatiellia bacterium]|jgi:4-alpha-glucanotransferase
MNFPRESGILLHPTSLPGPYGIGDIGPEAYKFADTLAAMGQKLWQILPHGLTGYGDSPYQSFSTFAGNPLFISLDLLVQDGLLTAQQLERYPEFPAHTVDYGPVIMAKEAALNLACRGFEKNATALQKEAFREFCVKNHDWLEDFSLFMALKYEYNLEPWTTWAPELIGRETEAMNAARKRHKAAIRNVKILQYIFDDQWRRLRKHCHERGVKIVGDIPIFVAHDSADAWASPELFYLDSSGKCMVVAGVPPDYFSATGQLWGNPLYRWDVHKQTDYAWWVRRLRKIFEMVDIVRIDHFRGFAGYWEVPGDAETAMNGRWMPGPAHDLFHALKRQIPELPVIAEDLGVITEDVDRLRDDFNLPGMRILQFAFGNDEKAEEFRPHNYPENCVVYTGTHDNDTTVGWFWSEAGEGSTRSHEDIERERKTILDYVGTDGSEIQWDLIALALKSKANTAVFPLQDVIGLGTEARMNVPGTKSNNWRWRFTWDMLTAGMKERLATLTKEAGR